MDGLVVKWPARTFAFYAQVRAAYRTILRDTILAIDPSSGGSSQPGYAIFKAGELVASGELKLPARKPIHERLAILYDKLSELIPEQPAILALEDVSKGTMGHEYLKWAAGVSIAAARANELVITPINVWRALAKATPSYKKDNATDAVFMGQSLVLLAREHEAAQKRIKQRRRRGR